MSKNTIPLVVHLIYRLDFGGLETLLAECVNCMPAHKYRHAIVCLTDYTDFAKKITQPGVEIFALHKAPGLALDTHARLWKLLRKLRPTILHTYNLAAIEYAFTATLAGVPVRIHAEHGRDASDPEGKNRKHNLLRRWLVPFIDCYIPVSGDLQRWLKNAVGVPDAKNLLINNGVDTERFKKDSSQKNSSALWDVPQDGFVIGTVGRIQDVKNHAGLIDAFIELQARLPEQKARLRLAIVGDGPLRKTIEEKIASAGIENVVWLPGARTDIADIMQTFSVFALSSIAEGTPVTILEAMSIGLPVVATHVGGIPALVVDHATGILVPPNDADALASALVTYIEQPAIAKQHGAAGRERIERQYSVTAMLAAYTALYDRLCKSKTKLNEVIEPCAE
ncbi:MAG TPA: TIGR03088 family PEP-CTERM/XrtA system glycosyltransferase [Burkholderiaceae bacterium]|jgi:sugar transferase (PEP-CTERM/EpsH1 system associated)